MPHALCASTVLLSNSVLRGLCAAIDRLAIASSLLDSRLAVLLVGAGVEAQEEEEAGGANREERRKESAVRLLRDNDLRFLILTS